MDEHGNFFVATPIPPSTSSVSCSSIVVYMEGLRQEFPRAPHGHGRRLHEWFLLSSGLTPARLSGAGLGGRAWKVQASLLGVVLIAGSPGGKWNGCQGWRQPSRSDAVGALYSRGASATLIQPRTPSSYWIWTCAFIGIERSPVRSRKFLQNGKAPRRYQRRGASKTTLLSA